MNELEAIRKEGNRLDFVKYQSNGNHFVIIDERLTPLKERSRSALSARLCDPKRSVGADSVLFLQDSDRADIRMRVFEQDGSESDMCGNGVRCVIAYLLNSMPVDSFSVETNGGMISARPEGPCIRINAGGLQDPSGYLSDLSKFQRVNAEIWRTEYLGKTVYILSIGEPHAILVDDIDIDLTRFIDFSKNPDLFPQGINLNVVSKIDGHTVRIRTLERGVWGYTSSCGTGSICCAALCRSLLGCQSDRITVLNDIGSQEIRFAGDGICASARAELVFTGSTWAESNS